MIRLGIAAMGTRFELVLGAGAGDLVAAGEAALAEIAECHARFSRFASDSLVSHLARTPAHTPVRLDRDTFALFADARAVSRASAGAFDMTIAPLMAAHGFTQSEVATATRVGMDALVLDERDWTVQFTAPGAALDFGAIAKGHALDLAAAILRDAGVRSALLHGGTSSVVAIGAPEDADGWAIALPFTASSPVVRLRDMALAVSNPAAQSGGDGAGHIMDPRSERPARACHAAVIGTSARLCDAWSTALAVLGEPPPDFPRAYRALIDR